MVITSTAIAFILLSFGLAFCGWRFFVAFRQRESSKENRKIGFLLSLYFFVTATHNGLLGVGALLFAQNPEGLYVTSAIAHVVLTIFAMLGVYIVRYIFFPHKSSLLAIVLVGILGGIGEVVIITAHPQPFLTQQNSVDWSGNPSLSLITFYLFLISFTSITYTFFKLFRTVTSREIKILSLVISLAALAGIVNVFTWTVLLYNTPATMRSRVLDVNIGIVGLVFVVVFIILPMLRKSDHIRKQ